MKTCTNCPKYNNCKEICSDIEKQLPPQNVGEYTSRTNHETRKEIKHFSLDNHITDNDTYHDILSVTSDKRFEYLEFVDSRLEKLPYQLDQLATKKNFDKLRYMQIATLYHKEGLTIREICKAFGLHTTSHVHKILKTIESLTGLKTDNKNKTL